MSIDDVYMTFVNPPDEFTQIPWWFWNDEITEEGIKQQLADFRQQGVYGFTIHARMGLSPSIPYLGARWLELVRFAVQEAARHGMVVHLYDEGMYPSGSAHGQVVEGHPEFLARGLEMREVTLSKLELGHQEKCIAVLMEGQTEAILSSEVSNLKSQVSYRAFVITPSGGTIRGVHEGEDDRQPNAPFAADLLNTAAVRRFIELTHERYYQELREYFGTIVQAFFTDEPSIMGRGAKRGLKPWTDGLEEQFRQEKGYDLIPLLPALWNDIGARTASIRRDYEDVVANRLNDSFYKQLSDWCATHNVALTGHPAESDDIGPLRYFQLPGQDMVWRYVEPEKSTALEGKHSTVGKCSSSSARHRGARRNGNEVYGAYGWKLTMDEMKWLADWLMVRGVNLLWPHAFYYSIRGSRAHERPPDLGRHNLWWKHYRIFSEYTKRLCWLLTDSRQICDIAVLARHNHLPWEPAKALFQHQWDFDYLEDRLLTEASLEKLCSEGALPSQSRLKIGDSSYTTIVRMVDQPLSKPAEDILERFSQSGGRIITFNPSEAGGLFIKKLEDSLAPDVMLEPANSDLRYVRMQKCGLEFYYLVNEGGSAIEGKLKVRAPGHAEWWNPLTGKSTPAVVLARDERAMSVALRLERREGTVLAIDPGRAPVLKPDWQPMKVVRRIDISTGWKLRNPATGAILGEDVKDWTALDGYKDFSGTLVYEKSLNVKQHKLRNGKWILNLGDVRDFAEVFCNGAFCGVKLWGPFWFELPIRPGVNTLQVAVTNSMANELENASLASGIMSDVALEQTE